MKNIILTVVVALLLSACSSLRVNVDYDTEFDFTSQKSFAVAHHNREGEDTLYNDRLIEALVADLNAKLYEKVEKNSADLIFVFHTNVENKIDIDTDYTMIGYRRYGYGGHMMATTRTYQYKKGTLIIDALNPKDNKIVWRGIATDVLKTHDNPAERVKYINNVIKETMKDFPSKTTVK